MKTSYLGAAEPIEWPPVSLVGTDLLSLKWRPLAHSVCHDEASGLHFGRSVWLSDDRGQRAGIAWNWEEVQPQILVVANALAIETNIEVEDQTAALTTSNALVRSLNLVVYTLPWQRHLLSQFPPPPEGDVVANR